MKRYIFTFFALLLISSATASAQGFGGGMNFEDAGISVTQTTTTDGNLESCFKFNNKGGCIIQNSDGEVIGGSFNGAVPIYPGVKATMSAGVGENDKFSVCGGAEFGVPRANVEVQGCAEVLKYGTIRVYTKTNAQAGPFNLNYESKHHSIPRSHN